MIRYNKEIKMSIKIKCNKGILKRMLAGLFTFAMVLTAVSGEGHVSAETQGKTYTTIRSDSQSLLKYQSVMDDVAPDNVIFKESTDTIKEHKLIAENDKLQMYFNPSSLSVIIRDKKSGAIMESIVEGDVEGKSNQEWQAFLKSSIVLKVMKGINIMPTIAGLQKARKDISYTQNGFSANVYYDEYGLGYQLNVTLTEDGFVVEIPKDSIKEDMDEYKIGEIYIFPFMGHTHLGERSGYMFIPDGNGALIYINDKKGKFSSSFSE